MKILFQCEQLNFRGTTNSTYDYARYNQEILGNESAIVYSSVSPSGLDVGSHPDVVDEFKNHFNVLQYDSEEHLNEIASKYDFCYSQRAGYLYEQVTRKKQLEVKSTKFGVHSVFQWYEPHGDVYAYISEWLSDNVAKTYNAPLKPFVPYVVDLPEPSYNLREVLGISKNKLVFGRHGGFNTFDIPFVYEVIKKIVSERDDIVFLFLNTVKFIDHPNVIHLNSIFDRTKISNFINACDAMIHARWLGESFGLSIAEFLFHNKPVIAWKGGFDRNHAHILNDYNCLYGTEDNEDARKIWCGAAQECYNMIVNFRDRPKQDFKKIVEPFTPQNVMKKFQEVYL
jgi:glycosyltransferase involved in cell wall biosynthesis